jgi:hypothetical protein
VSGDIKAALRRLGFELSCGPARADPGMARLEMVLRALVPVTPFTCFIPAGVRAGTDGPQRLGRSPFVDELEERLRATERVEGTLAHVILLRCA